MEKKINNILAKIKTKMKKLNECADEATNNITIIERKLRETGVGIDIWGPVFMTEDATENPQYPTTASYCLGFIHIKKDCGLNRPYWGLAIKKTFNTRNERIIIPLIYTSRKLRLAAMTSMEQFLCEVEKQVKNHTEELERFLNSKIVTEGDSAEIQ